jgi:hypothetical protein
MDLNTIWTFIAAHWHHILGVLAFFFAVYNKWQHSKLLNTITEKLQTKKTKAKSKHKKHHKK